LFILKGKTSLFPAPHRDGLQDGIEKITHLVLTVMKSQKLKNVQLPTVL